MSLIPSLALIIGLGGRVLLNSVQPSPFTESQTSDTVVLGLWHGALLQYAISEHSQLAPILGVAIIAWDMFDFSQTNDARKLAMTVFSAIVCAAALTMVSQALGAEEVVEKTVEREVIRAPRSPTEKEKDRNRSNKDRHKSSKKTRDTREPSIPRRIPHAVRSVQSDGRETHRTDDTIGTLEYIGHTGLEVDFELRLSNLRKRAAVAEANRRRCKEERKWALDQGNSARAEQLAWQIKRYAAIAESYNKEADRALIEATKQEIAASSPTQPTTITNESTSAKPFIVSNGHHHQYVEYAGNGPDYGRHYATEMKRTNSKSPIVQSQLPTPPQTSPSRTYRDKGKTPIRTVDDYNAMQLPKSAYTQEYHPEWI